MKKNEWQSIADDIEIEVESNTENKDIENKDIENKDIEKEDIEKEDRDNKAEYTWDKI